MKRRTFIKNSAIGIIVGYNFVNQQNSWSNVSRWDRINMEDLKPYKLFKAPPSYCRPFVRWWWNGNKVEKEELVRELRLMKKAGIGGVEINPIAFPSTGDDLGIKSLTWLSDEWIEMLNVVFDEAKRLDMTCDLIVGSGWPFGEETLQGEERAQVMLINAEKLNGPVTYESSQFNIFRAGDRFITQT